MLNFAVLSPSLSLRRPRLWAGAVTVAIELMIIVLLVLNSGSNHVSVFAHEMKTFTISPLREQNPPSPPRHIAQKRSSSASSANVHSKATAVVAPPATVMPPPPISASTNASTGTDPTGGASTITGPGSGRGGVGNGAGMGGSGDGEGNGEETPPRRISGKINNSDYPHDAALAGFEGTVILSYTVETSGRASDCKITQTSGSRALDENTCRLIVERFRFEPSRDRDGRAVTSYIDDEQHSWKIKIQH